MPKNFLSESLMKARAVWKRASNRCKAESMA